MDVDGYTDQWPAVWSSDRRAESW